MRCGRCFEVRSVLCCSGTPQGRASPHHQSHSDAMASECLALLAANTHHLPVLAILRLRSFKLRIASLSELYSVINRSPAKQDVEVSERKGQGAWQPAPLSKYPGHCGGLPSCLATLLAAAAVLTNNTTTALRTQSQAFFRISFKGKSHSYPISQRWEENQLLQQSRARARARILCWQIIQWDSGFPASTRTALLDLQAEDSMRARTFSRECAQASICSLTSLLRSVLR